MNEKEKPGIITIIIANIQICFLNMLLALLLEFFLEYTLRRSAAGVIAFVEERTFVFLYNAVIVFASLSVVLVFRKKIFAYAMLVGGWLLIGTANYVILSGRKTPFTAVDLTLARSTLPIINAYLKMWQLIGILVLLTAAIVGLVCLFLYTPEQAKYYHSRCSLAFLVLIFCGLIAGTRIGFGRQQLIGKFDNLINGYHDYGVAFGFCITALDTGVDRPIDYSRERVYRLKKRMEKKKKALEKKETVTKRTPNIIFIQLESFFDISSVKGLHASEDVLPNIHRIQREYTSGYLKVPVYGAGTVNTEFEILTGMNLDYFGTGEYPYRSVLHKKTCDNINYWMKDAGYYSSAIHNNNASFYDRDKVFRNLGTDCFITIENMDVGAYNEAGWPRDSVLTQYILDTLDRTRQKDLIYTISVQGHGEYLSSDQSDKRIQIRPDNEDQYTQAQCNQFTYYANETYDMDRFIGDLLARLADYPEDTMVIAYGDHLPGMNFETRDLRSGSKYKTPYFIWDNFGYNREHREKESGTLEAWQLASKVAGQIGMHQGSLNLFHQTMAGTKNYRRNLKLLQYDMLYGSDFIRDGEEEREPSDLVYTLRPVRVDYVLKREKEWIIAGEGFNEASRVYVNGRKVKSKRLSSRLLKLGGSRLKDKDEIVIHQVSATNEKITLNESEPFTYNKAPEDK